MIYRSEIRASELTRVIYTSMCSSRVGVLEASATGILPKPCTHTGKEDIINDEITPRDQTPTNRLQSQADRAHASVVHMVQSYDMGAFGKCMEKARRRAP